MARKPKKNQAQQPDMLGTAEPADDLLRTNLNAPAEVLHENRRRRGRAIAWAFIVVGGISILMNLNTLANPVDPTAGIEPVDSVTVNSSLGKSVAHTYLIEWLATDPSPLPGGYVVSWDGFESIAGEDPEESASDSPANAAEIHRFTLATLVGEEPVFFDATVLVNVDDQLGARVAAEPSLLPRVPDANQGWSTTVWPGYASTAVSDSAQNTVAQWAKSFTESAEALRLYVGDEDPGHSYMPLQGARVLQADVTNAGYIKVEGEEKPTVIIARVELTLSWSATGEKGTATMYDVLIHKADTASPKVVAWGPAGTGPTLKMFGNALTGQKLSGGSNSGAPTPMPEPKETEPGVADEQPADPTDGGALEGGDGN